MKRKYKGMSYEEIYAAVMESTIEAVKNKLKAEEKLTPEEKLNQKYLKKFKRALHVQPFSIETIRKAYEVTGLDPTQGIYYINSFGTIVNRAYIDDQKEIACPMGALCASKDSSYLHLDGDLWKEACVAQILNVPTAFVSGFIQGFDGYNPPHERSSPWLIQGYDNGKTILGLMVASKELKEINNSPPESFPTQEAEKDLVNLIQKELDFDKRNIDEQDEEDEVVEDYEAEPDEPPPPILTKKSKPKEEILIDLNKPLKEAILEMLSNFEDTNLFYLLHGRYNNKRMSVALMKEEVSQNSILAQQYVLDLLYIAKDTLAKETERLPFKIGNVSKPLPPRKVTIEPDLVTFLHEDEDL